MGFFPACATFDGACTTSDMARRIFCGKQKLFKSILASIFLLSCFVTLVHLSSPVVFATPTPTPPTATPTPAPHWELDYEVTQVGRGAERARQFLWWTLSHPAVHYAPIIAQMWANSRNIVYFFIVLVIVAFGLGLILSKRSGGLGPVFSGISAPLTGYNIFSVLWKVAVILLYVTFSYILVLALIQTSELSMKFIMEIVGGKDLFNVVFSGSGNVEANYNFIGFRFSDPLQQEMANTSLFVVRFTSFTYYVLALILILRNIILWFLLIMAPFLALLMPFVFIRNIGWIWIGVFFQWLFYGPLLYLFLVSTVKIWEAGIPYSFDFSRTDCSGVGMPRTDCTGNGLIYQTAINILYGGPAQHLTKTNTGNYVDTFAEYLISLVMLWATIILPWLLLRTFRDYCCEMIAAGNSTLNALFDRIRQYPTPPASQPSAPSSAAGVTVELPFRQKVIEKIQEVHRTSIEDIKDVSKMHTTEIVRALDLSVSSLSDVSRLELSDLQRSVVQENLGKISAPTQLGSVVERERFAQLRSELVQRANSGDKEAATLLAATKRGTQELVTHTVMMGVEKGAGVRVSEAIGVSAGMPLVSSSFISQMAVKTQLFPNKVREVLNSIPTAGGSFSQMITAISQKTNLSETKVQEILTNTSQQVVSQPTSIQNISQVTNVPQDKVKQVLTSIPAAGLPVSQMITNIAQKTGLSEDKINEVILLSTQTATAGVVQKPKKAVVPTNNVSVEVGGQKVQSQVTVDDYEEVKKMWLKHYREAPIPVSEKIKSRQYWLEEDVKQLTNVSNLIASSDPRMKQKGLEACAEILPFMLLGGFSDVEILTYLKAKLEAAKQIQTELEIVEKAKEEAKIEEEGELIEVAPKKEEEKKSKTAEGKLSIKLPEDKKEDRTNDETQLNIGEVVPIKRKDDKYH